MGERQDQDPAAWLADLQRQWGITYTEDDAEKHLRAAFDYIMPAWVRAGAVSVTYYGYREAPGPGAGSRVRTTLRTLTSTVRMADGRTYHLTLTGPYREEVG